MANGMISWDNRVDDATITSDSQTAGLPATNLADPIIGKPWRTSGATTAYASIDFGAEVTVRILLIAGTDIAPTDTIRHRVSSASGGAASGDLLDTGAITSDVVSGYAYHAYILNSEVSARYWRIDITATSLASQGYFEVGRAWAGPVLQPGRNFNYGQSLQWEDNATIQEADRSGARYVDPTFARRVRQFQYESLTNAEARSAEDLDREAGRRGQIAIIPDPDSSYINREALFGRLASISPIEFGPSAPNWNAKTYEISEDT